MGNNPSSASKPTTPSSSHAHTPSHSSSHSHGHDSPKPPKRDSKHPIPVQNNRVAAPPEPSLAQAQGSTPIIRGKSLHPRPVASLNSSSPSSSTSSSLQPSKPPDQKAKTDTTRHEPTRPVDVPAPQPELASSPNFAFAGAADEPIAPTSSVSDMSYLTRPPRLPLPIEEEVHTPGSPIITPADIAEPVGDVDGLDSEDLARKTSILSTTTADDEDEEGLRVDRTRPTVPTRLEWLRGGDKVYVTGTIFQWNRKTRLHPVEGQPGVFAATINILPGTHHVRFLVDGHMQTSPDLPTTVDFGNNLVNYIEVNPDDVPPGPEAAGADAAGKDSQLQSAAGAAPSTEEEAGKPQRGKTIPVKSAFSHQIPKYLGDFDQPEDSPHYNRAVNAIEKLPTPPSLPGFLGKPILNAAVLIKDDNSVLNMPNHTVLNHLATSSIKNNILAVSATTRYKHKYVTTIIYKPTSTDD